MKKFALLVPLLVLALVAACGPAPTPTPTPTATPTAIIRVASPAATPSAPPTYTPTPKPTLPVPQSVSLKFGQTVTFRYLPNAGTIWMTFSKYIRQGAGYRAEIAEDACGGFDYKMHVVVMQFGFLDRVDTSRRVPFEVRHYPLNTTFIFEADDVIAFGIEYQTDEESKIWYDPVKVEPIQ